MRSSLTCKNCAKQPPWVHNSWIAWSYGQGMDRICHLPVAIFATSAGVVRHSCFPLEAILLLPRAPQFLAERPHGPGGINLYPEG